PASRGCPAQQPRRPLAHLGRHRGGDGASQDCRRHLCGDWRRGRHAAAGDLEVDGVVTERAHCKPLGLSPGGEAAGPWREPDVLVCDRFRAARCEYAPMSEQTTQRTCRKTYQEQLRPTPAQERALERTLWRCRTLYTTALEQRITRASPAHHPRITRALPCG